MPDMFGFETPQEAQERVRSRFAEASARVSALGQNATPGQRVGSALSNIFGGATQAFLDTRMARKEETAKLVAAGLPEEIAKEKAKQAVPMQYREVRQAKKFENMTAGADELVQTLIADGVAPNAAQGAGMLFLSNKLREQGMRREASALSVQAGKLFTEEEERVANLNKVKAETDREGILSAQTLQDIRLKSDSDDDTYVLMDPKKGRVSDFKSVSAGDVQERRRLRDAGYINMGNSPFGIQLDKEVFGAPAPIDTEDLGFQFGLLDTLDMLEGIAPDVGFGTPFKALLAERGVDIFGSGELVEPVAAQRNIRAGIQSIIKGIPSNYDASIFEKMIPDLFRFQDGDFYQAQVDVLQQQTRSLIELRIAAHKGSKQPLPRDILMMARRAGIDVDSIQGIGPENIDAAVRAHEEQTRSAFAQLKQAAPGMEAEEGVQVTPGGVKFRVIE